MGLLITIWALCGLTLILLISLVILFAIEGFISLFLSNDHTHSRARNLGGTTRGLDQ